MSGRCFLDTNLFVYSFDTSAPEKQKVSIEIIQQSLQNLDAVISTQVVQEFLHVATRKFRVPLRASDARAYLQKVLMPLCSVYPSQELYEEALAVSATTGFSFYDSLVVAGALQASCEVLLTEDMQHGQRIRNLQIQNPFC